MNHQILYCLEDNPLCLMNNLMTGKEEKEVVIINYLYQPKFNDWHRQETYFEQEIKIAYYEINIEKAKKLFSRKLTYLNVEKYSLDFLKMIL